MLGAKPVEIEVDGEKLWFVSLVDYCRLERRVEELLLELERERSGGTPCFMGRQSERIAMLETSLGEAYQISHYGRGSMQDVDDILERAIRGNIEKV
jgi:hypothetical protein